MSRAAWTALRCSPLHHTGLPTNSQEVSRTEKIPPLTRGGSCSTFDAFPWCKKRALCLSLLSCSWTYLEPEAKETEGKSLELGVGHLKWSVKQVQQRWKGEKKKLGNLLERYRGIGQRCSAKFCNIYRQCLPAAWNRLPGKYLLELVANCGEFVFS